MDPAGQFSIREKFVLPKPVEIVGTGQHLKEIETEINRARATQKTHYHSRSQEN
jgi:hypothetical protein